MRPRIALLVLVGALALVAAGCGGDDNSSGAEETAPATTETTGGDTGGESGDAANGKTVFASAGCGGCHTFEAAGSSGSVPWVRTQLFVCGGRLFASNMRSPPTVRISTGGWKRRSPSGGAKPRLSTPLRISSS